MRFRNRPILDITYRSQYIDIVYCIVSLNCKEIIALAVDSILVYCDENLDIF